MKRALAERAKQSLNAAVTNAKQHQHEMNINHRILPQQPPEVSAAIISLPSDSNSSSLPNKVINDASSNESLRPVPAEERRPDLEGTAMSGSPSCERPLKIPRLEKPPEFNRESPNNATSSIPQSPRAMTKQNKTAATATESNIQLPPPKRRFSMDPPQRATSETVTVKSSSKKKDEAEEESNSAFYLKHQNRALATELKSLQFALTQLEEEREARRSHCYTALRAVHALHNIWSAMEEQTVGPQQQSSDSSPSQMMMMDTSQDPPSTGTGDSVEWTRALRNALVALGQRMAVQQRPEETSDADHLEQAVVNIAARAKVLQDWLGSVLASGSIPAVSAEKNQQDGGGCTADQRLHNLQCEMAVVTARCTELEAQLSELAASRQEVVSRERRVRRNIYRMAAGMLSPEQVANTLEQGDEDDELEAAVQLEKQQIKSENYHHEKSEKVVAQKKEDDASDSKQSADHVVSSAQVDEFQARISSLEEAVSSAEKAMEDLNLLLNEKERRITELSKRQLSDDDASKLESLQSTLLQLKTSQSRVSDLQSKLSKSEEKWSQALGNEKAALAAVEELISKFNKRWSEFNAISAPSNSSAAAPAEGIIAPLPENNPHVVMVKQMAELQHKLDQALENVRQSETTRDNLKIILAMNASLQSKLDEVKSKYAAVQASRSSASNSASNRPAQGAASKHSVDAAVLQSSSTALKEKDGSTADQKPSADGSNSRSDKLHRAYRNARKELAAMTASKEAAKAKFERAEKERDSLMESNIRLLKQIGEKDEMNTTSLSTILHLKSMTEKLMAERDNLEQQVKSASQLALAARLATNAKERVSEEVLKEKTAIEGRLDELERQYHVMQIELERVSAEWSDASGRMAVKESELTNALKRSDELVTENEQKREEIRKLVDIVNKAEREARDAKEVLASAIKSGVAIGGDAIGGASGGTSSFSVDQLKTQVSVLKSRLACPVCHYRDKECIILRCRHMHCKQCVDERISNRSRKCPTCNVKFSENDVGDVWLS